MGAESLLRFRRVPMYSTAWILLAVLLAGLVLLACAGLLGLMSPDPSPANERLLMGPFRWLSPDPGAA